jgi:hypothetical protein
MSVRVSELKCAKAVHFTGKQRLQRIEKGTESLLQRLVEDDPESDSECESEAEEEMNSNQIVWICFATVDIAQWLLHYSPGMKISVQAKASFWTQQQHKKRDITLPQFLVHNWIFKGR